MVSAANVVEGARSARRVVIGLGSNVGDRAANLAAAASRLESEAGLRPMGWAPVYESKPAGGPPQGDYLNTAILVETALPARELLGRLLGIERALGRDRAGAVRWGPRTIDLDLLWVEGEAIAEEGLEVPHPRLTERAFALRPLLDLVPEARDARTGAPLSALAAAREPLRRVADSV